MLDNGLFEVERSVCVAWFVWLLPCVYIIQNILQDLPAIVQPLVHITLFVWFSSIA